MFYMVAGGPKPVDHVGVDSEADEHSERGAIHIYECRFILFLCCFVPFLL